MRVRVSVCLRVCGTRALTSTRGALAGHVAETDYQNTRSAQYGFHHVENSSAEHVVLFCLDHVDTPA